MDSEEKKPTITPKSRVSIALAATIAVPLIYGARMEARVESLEAGRTEMEAKLDKLLAKVEDVRVHIAAMDRHSDESSRPR